MVYEDWLYWLMSTGYTGLWGQSVPLLVFSDQSLGFAVLPLQRLILGLRLLQVLIHRLHTDRQTGSQTDRWSDRQVLRQTGSQTDRWSDRQADRETDRSSDRQVVRQTGCQADR